MITTRARGLASLHTGVTTFVMGAFFWGYAEFILRQVPWVRLTREVNLLPYFLCVLGGMALARRENPAWIGGPDVLRAANAARLAARQVALEREPALPRFVPRVVRPPALGAERVGASGTRANALPARP